MSRPLFHFRSSRLVIILFWIMVLGVFATIYFFYPSIWNQMQQSTYQNTPYVNTPMRD